MFAKQRNLCGLGMAAVLLLAGCGGSGDAVDPAEPPLDDAATDTASSTPPSERPCGGSSTCVNAGSVSLGHGEAFVQLHVDPERNDAVTRWGRSLGDIIDCVDGGQAMRACVAASDSREDCKAEFVRLADLGGEFAAFDAVFLTAGGLCRPEEGEP
tara:strand:+ start:650 stop:1117 length:468 start_codon:yes stop_codon:yes gene_type:complete